MRVFDLEAMVIHLESVIEYAKKLGFDAHFISEVKHLISTIRANQ